MSRINKIIRVLLLVFLYVQILLTSILPVVYSQQTTGSWRYDRKRTVLLDLVSISADGNYIIAQGRLGGSEDNGLYFFDRTQSTPLWIYETGNIHIDSVAISSNGNFAVAGTDNGTVYCFNTSESTPLWSHNCSRWSITSVSITANGSHVVAGGGETICLYDNTNLGNEFDKSSFKPLFNLTVHGGINSMEISANGKYVVFGSSWARVFLLNGADLSHVWNYSMPDAIVWNTMLVSISDNGTYIAAGAGLDQKVYFFEAINSTPKWVAATTGDVEELGISANGEYIVVGSDNYFEPDHLYLFNRSGSTPEWAYPLPFVNSVAISSNGTYIAAGATVRVTSGPDDQEVLLFNKNSSAPILNLDLPTESCSAPIRRIDISSNGRYIVATECGFLFMYDRTDPIIREKNEPTIDSYIIPGMIAAIGAVLLIIIRMRRN